MTTMTHTTTARGRLVRAELIKIRATRSTWILAAIAVIFCALWTVVSALTLADPGGLSTDEAIQNVYQNAQQGYLFALIFGILGMTGEYRHQTITWSFLGTPRRERVLAAKLLGYGVFGGLAIAIACAASTALAALIALSLSDAPLFAPGVPAVLLGSVLSTVLYTVLGVAVGALIPNQVAALSVAFSWFYYAEFLLVWFLPDVGRWVPGGAAKALSGWNIEQGELLPAWLGGVVFGVYAGVLCAGAYAFTTRRDVT